MALLQKWLKAHAHANRAPLFLEEDLVVRVCTRGHSSVLKRHHEFDELMIRTVEQGLSTTSWQGLIYVMHWLRDETMLPLYVGKAERQGKKNALSANVANIRRVRGPFGRWGYGQDYHAGDLSRAMFGFGRLKASVRNHRRWAEALFSKFGAPTLREVAYVSIIGWYEGIRGRLKSISVSDVEAELIVLASTSYPGLLLNIAKRLAEMSLRGCLGRPKQSH